ncbi:hypothetical protein KAJ89_05530, partial [Candidatus Parcubacteria bacterium]|nr:hypothetical protein [Candidatus Parcubacteria bacterium]
MKSLIKLLVLILCFFIAGPVFAASSTDTFAKFPEGYHGVNLGDKWMDVKHVLTASNTLFKRG